MISHENEVNRRQFLTTLMIAAGLPVLGLSFGDSAAPIPSRRKSAHGRRVRISNVAYQNALKRAKSLVERMTLEQQISQLGAGAHFGAMSNAIPRLTQAAMYYAYAGRPIPLATHHLMDVWRMLKTIILPWGETADPQGMDWELHGVPFINLYATLATHSKDPYAARMEQTTLQYMRDWQIMCQGSLTVPGSRFGIVRHAITVEQAAYGFLAHKIFGPSIKELTARAAAVQQESVWEYPDVGFIAHRTLGKFASFSWQNRIMGLLMPIEDHEDNPDFAVPMTDGYVGSFKLYPGGSLKTTVVEHSWRKTPDGFETAGTLLLDWSNSRTCRQLQTATVIGTLRCL